MTKKLLAYLALFAALNACTSNRHANQLIAEAETFVHSNPDSTLTILSKIDDSSTLADSLQARYWLLRSQAHYNKGMSLYEDSLIGKSVEYFEKTKPSNRSLLLQSYLMRARYLFSQNKKQEAVALLKKGLGQAKEQDGERQKILLSLATFCAEDGVGDFATSVECLNELIRLNTDKSMDLFYRNALAIGQYYLGNLDAAEQIYINLHSSIRTPQDTAFAWDYAWRNYADFLNDCGNYQKAIELQEKVLHHYKSTQNPSIVNSYVSLAWYHLNLKQPDKALQYIKLAESCIKGNDSFDLENLLMIERFILDYEQTDRFSFGKICLFSNQMQNKLLNDSQIKSAQEREAFLLQQKNLELTVEKQRNELIMVVVVCFAMALAASVCMYVRRRKRLIMEKDDEIEALKMLISESKHSDEKQKDDRFFKKIMLQQLGIIRMLSENPSSANQEILHRMTEIADKEIRVDSLLNWNDLYTTIDFIYDGYHSSIVSKYGNLLNEREVQLCCLLKANFATKEISVVTQQSVRTVYQRKTQIRQKLQLEEKADIADFLSQP